LEFLEDRTAPAASLGPAPPAPIGTRGQLDAERRSSATNNVLNFDTTTAGLTGYTSNNDIAGLTGLTINVNDANVTKDFVISGLNAASPASTITRPTMPRPRPASRWR